MSCYLNNAATSWPKPAEVAEAMTEFLTRGGANLARGSASARDLGAMNLALDCRVRLAALLGGDPRHVTFTANVTEGLNIVIKGFLRPGMRVISTSMEHNAVVRPLRGLGVGVRFLPCGKDGLLDVDVFREALRYAAASERRHRGPGSSASRRPAVLVILNHASNVCGTIQPLPEIADLCRKAEIPLVVDAAQTAGTLPIDAAGLGISALCFTGHKSLMGPQGIGGVLWDPEFASHVEPLIEGGTGSFSHSEEQPTEMPDKFESGTPNLPGIAGLHAALGWLARVGTEKIAKKEQELGRHFLEGLNKRIARKDDIVFYGRRVMSGRLPVFALNVAGVDNGLLADRLARFGAEGRAGSGSGSGKSRPGAGRARVREGFETRPGLHCAPLAHKTLGSFPEGSLRVSPGYFNTFDELDAFWEALEECTGTN
jgi:selenocysteine lyase/cysteine desulfurase